MGTVEASYFILTPCPTTKSQLFSKHLFLEIHVSIQALPLVHKTSDKIFAVRPIKNQTKNDVMKWYIHFALNLGLHSMRLIYCT